MDSGENEPPGIAASNSSTKSSALEKLSKEELLNKYRHLLNIAQKAKSAKDGKNLHQFI